MEEGRRIVIHCSMGHSGGRFHQDPQEEEEEEGDGGNQHTRARTRRSPPQVRRKRPSAALDVDPKATGPKKNTEDPRAEG